MYVIVDGEGSIFVRFVIFMFIGLSCSHGHLGSCAIRRTAKCAGCGDCPAETRVVTQGMGPFRVRRRIKVTKTYDACPCDISVVKLDLVLFTLTLQTPSAEKCKEEETPVTIHVEKGIRHGHVLTFEGMGEQQVSQFDLVQSVRHLFRNF